MNTATAPAPVIVDRPLAPRPPSFRAGSRVAFRSFDGSIVEGIFVRRYSPAPRAGIHYEVRTSTGAAILFANGEVGRSLTAQH